MRWNLCEDLSDDNVSDKNVPGRNNIMYKGLKVGMSLGVCETVC